MSCRGRLEIGDFSLDPDVDKTPFQQIANLDAELGNRVDLALELCCFHLGSIVYSNDARTYPSRADFGSSSLTGGSFAYNAVDDAECYEAEFILHFDSGAGDRRLFHKQSRTCRESGGSGRSGFRCSGRFENCAS